MTGVQTCALPISQVVLAAPGNHHRALRHPVLRQHGGYGVGPPHGQALVVIGRARCVGKSGDLNGYRGSRFIRLRGQPDDFPPTRTHNSAIPVKEDQESRRGRGGGGGGVAQAATVSIKQSKNRRFIRSSSG